ncbi:MAG: O-antigen ligase family protein [Candidatus Tectomicrobia bacterium]|nr:O-antigen ligase family protein [Candidatus Tectomicrobia bacterium]
MVMLGIFAYMITLYIRPQDWMPLFLGMPVNDWIVPFTLLFGIIGSNVKGGSRSLPQTYLLILFLAFVVFSNVLHGYFDAALQQFVIYIKRVAIFFMFVIALNSYTRIRYTLQFMVILSVILAIQGIDQSITGVGWAGQPLMPGYQEIRITWIGDWDGPNVLALLFITGLALILEFAFGPYGFWHLIVYSGLSAILVYGIYLTNSRAGWLSLLVVMSFYVFQRFRHVYTLIAMALCVFLFLSFSPSRMSRLNSGESSAHQRTWVWEQGLSHLRKNPVWGIGKGQFMRSSKPPIRAHNNYVEVSTEIGLAGFFVWLSLIYLSVKGLYQLQQHPAETSQQRRIISLARAMLGAMVGFSFATFFVSMELDIIFVLWGLCAAIILLGRNMFPDFSFEFKRKDVFVVWGGMVGILSLVYMIAILHIL